jgi:hypothetical protein
VANGLHHHKGGSGGGGLLEEQEAPAPEATTLDGAWWNQGPQQSLTLDDLPDFLKPR